MTAITPAASVLLSPAPGSAEVYAVRRGDRLKFFGGFWAFPGGRLDPGDLALAGATEPTAGALRVAACRELFEEAGVLIARPLPASGDALDGLRRELLAGRLPFGRLLAERGLTIHAEDFRPVGQITTPASSPVRFATTFFTAHLPPGQRAAVWPGELDEGRWSPVAALLHDWQRGICPLTPPAVVILRALDGHPVDAAPERVGPVFARRTDDALPDIWFAPFVRALPLRTAALPPTTHTNAYLVGPYLIDPGADDPHEQRRLLQALDGSAVRAVVLTHHHPDHVGAAAVSARHFGVPVWAHARTAERLRGRVVVDRLLDEGDRLDGDGFRLDVLHTPGHAPGHLVFVEPAHGLLFAGDMVSTQTSVVIVPPDGDLAAYLASLRRLRELPARLLLPGHGNASAQPQGVIDEALAHRAKREAQLIAALGDGPATIEALTPRLYRGVPEALWGLARKQIWAGLIKLQAEGRVRPAGAEGWELIAV